MYQAEPKEDRFELTKAFSYVTSGTIDNGDLSPMDWLTIISMSLDACKIVLRRVAEKRKNGGTFTALTSYKLENGAHDEKRTIPENVLNTFPKALLQNEGWLFIKVMTLETKEEKGQFFERTLFILADYGMLMIMDTYYRKDPHPNQFARDKPPKINENVVKCQILADREYLGFANKGFKEAILPFFGDQKLELGNYIMNHILDGAVTELREAIEKVEEMKRVMKPLLEMRKRMGIINIL